MQAVYTRLVAVLRVTRGATVNRHWHVDNQITFRTVPSPTADCVTAEPYRYITWRSDNCVGCGCVQRCRPSEGSKSPIESSDLIESINTDDQLPLGTVENGSSGVRLKRFSLGPCAEVTRPNVANSRGGASGVLQSNNIAARSTDSTMSFISRIT